MQKTCLSLPRYHICNQAFLQIYPNYNHLLPVQDDGSSSSLSHLRFLHKQQNSSVKSKYLFYEENPLFGKQFSLATLLPIWLLSSNCLTARLFSCHFGIFYLQFFSNTLPSLNIAKSLTPRSMPTDLLLFNFDLSEVSYNTEMKYLSVDGVQLIVYE